MTEFLPVILSVIGVAVVPFIGWLSQRWTREGRLLLRVNRLGSSLQLVPSSDERAALEGHLLTAVRDLNQWIDPINKGIRTVQRVIGILLYLTGSSFVLWLQSARDLHPTVSFLTSLAIGTLVALAILGTGFLMQRFFSRRRSNAELNNRIEKLRRGEGLA